MKKETTESNYNSKICSSKEFSDKNNTCCRSYTVKKINWSKDGKEKLYSKTLSRKNKDENSKKNESLTGKWERFGSLNKNIISSKSIHELTGAQLTHIKSVAILRLNEMLKASSIDIPSKVENKISSLFKRLFIKSGSNLLLKKKLEKSIKNSLQWNTEKYGNSFCPKMIEIYSKLLNNGYETPGIFRKSGRKCAITELEKYIYDDNLIIDYNNYSNYDLGDLLKSYLRNLPYSILDNNTVSLLASIHSYPSDIHLFICQICIILMSDENREAFYLILKLCRKISDNKNISLMDSNNLSICLIPSLTRIRSSTNNNNILSNLLNFKTSFSNDSNSQQLDSIASLYSLIQKSFTFLIENFEFLFSIPHQVYEISRLTILQIDFPLSLEKLGGKNDDYENFMSNTINELYDEHRNKYKAWNNFCYINNINISYKKGLDGYPLYLYRGSIEMDIDSTDLFTCYLYKEHLWEGNSDRYIIKSLSKHSDIFHQKISLFQDDYFVRHLILLRKWTTINNIHILSSTSIKINSKDLQYTNNKVLTNKVINLKSTNQAIMLAYRLIIEPLGQMRSRIIIILRLDLKGRRSSYYKHITPYFIYKELNFFKESCKKSI